MNCVAVWPPDSELHLWFDLCSLIFHLHNLNFHLYESVTLLPSSIISDICLKRVVFAFEPYHLTFELLPLNHELSPLTFDLHESLTLLPSSIISDSWFWERCFRFWTTSFDLRTLAFEPRTLAFDFRPPSVFAQNPNPLFWVSSDRCPFPRIKHI